MSALKKRSPLKAFLLFTGLSDERRRWVSVNKFRWSPVESHRAFTSRSMETGTTNSVHNDNVNTTGNGDSDNGESIAGKQGEPESAADYSSVLHRSFIKKTSGGIRVNEFERYVRQLDWDREFEQLHWLTTPAAESHRGDDKDGGKKRSRRSGLSGLFGKEQSMPDPDSDNDNNKYDCLTSKIGQYPQNDSRNRYCNIFPYDQTRVKLLKEGENDYVNANYIDGFTRANEFIATQGPIPTTVTDFWEMVWEQRSTVIVMLTNIERQRGSFLSCEQYWPVKVGTTATHGYWTIKLIKQDRNEGYNVNRLSVTYSKDGTSRTISHYQFTGWPDYGVPDTVEPLVALTAEAVAESRASGRTREEGEHEKMVVAPIIVHCSAGVGRTGSLIVVAAMMDEVRRFGTVSIYPYLAHIRAQRMWMVQTTDQYMFCHYAILRWIQDQPETDNVDVVEKDGGT